MSLSHLVTFLACVAAASTLQCYQCEDRTTKVDDVEQAREFIWIVLILDFVQNLCLDLNFTTIVWLKLVTNFLLYRFPTPVDDKNVPCATSVPTTCEDEGADACITMKYDAEIVTNASAVTTKKEISVTAAKVGFT